MRQWKKGEGPGAELGLNLEAGDPTEAAYRAHPRPYLVGMGLIALSPRTSSQKPHPGLAQPFGLPAHLALAMLISFRRRCLKTRMHEYAPMLTIKKLGGALRTPHTPSPRRPAALKSTLSYTLFGPFRRLCLFYRPNCTA